MKLLDLLPHAPQVGIYVAPEIPEVKLSNALKDYAKDVDADDVAAVYDATLMGSAKDGAVFTNDRLVFQNNDLEPVHSVRYADLVQVDAKKKLLGGKRLVLTVNRGRATFELEMDFSGRPEAATYVLRFLREAMLRVEEPEAAGEVVTDVKAVRSALEQLQEDGLLSSADYDAMMRQLER